MRRKERKKIRSFFFFSCLIFTPSNKLNESLQRQETSERFVGNVELEETRATESSWKFFSHFSWKRVRMLAKQRLLQILLIPTFFFGNLKILAYCNLRVGIELNNVMSMIFFTIVLGVFFQPVSQKWSFFKLLFVWNVLFSR